MTRDGPLESLELLIRTHSSSQRSEKPQERSFRSAAEETQTLAALSKTKRRSGTVRCGGAAGQRAGKSER
jgi:hypothetical protein